MKCVECGAAMKRGRENYRYSECGLRYVTLMGVEVSRCPKCGNYEVAIPRIEELHRLISRILIDKMTRFTGSEVRFLRKSLGLSGAAFARRMGVTAETVSRWEQSVVPIGTQADRLLRLLVVQGKRMTKYPEKSLERIDSKKIEETKLGLKPSEAGWSLVAA